MIQKAREEEIRRLEKGYVRNYKNQHCGDMLEKIKRLEQLYGESAAYYGGKADGIKLNAKLVIIWTIITVIILILTK